MGGFGIIKNNPSCTYYPLVPKLYTFNATKGSAKPETTWAVLWKKYYFITFGFLYVFDVFEWFRKKNGKNGLDIGN